MIPGSGADVSHQGGCHCGGVRWKVQAPADLPVVECNCSMCAKVGFLHLIVDADAFSLETDEDDLSLYQFGTGTAKHWFCSVCGVKSFYVPRSHPDGYSVNVRCIDPGTIASMRIEPFDGQNWEEARKELR